MGVDLLAYINNGQGALDRSADDLPRPIFSFNNLNDLRAALKAERYGDEQFLGSAQLRRQMAVRIANAKSRSDAVPPTIES